jgi:hypothetical protein
MGRFVSTDQMSGAAGLSLADNPPLRGGALRWAAGVRAIRTPPDHPPPDIEEPGKFGAPANSTTLPCQHKGAASECAFSQSYIAIFNDAAVGRGWKARAGAGRRIRSAHGVGEKPQGSHRRAAGGTVGQSHEGPPGAGQCGEETGGEGAPGESGRWRSLVRGCGRRTGTRRRGVITERIPISRVRGKRCQARREATRLAPRLQRTPTHPSQRSTTRSS